MNRFIDDIIREFPTFIWHIFVITGFIAAWVVGCGIVRYFIGARKRSRGADISSH
jgi:hypothetical protein